MEYVGVVSFRGIWSDSQGIWKILLWRSKCGVVEGYGAVEDSWPPPTPPSLTLSDLEVEGEREMNKLYHNYSFGNVNKA